MHKPLDFLETNVGEYEETDKTWNRKNCLFYYHVELKGGWDRPRAGLDQPQLGTEHIHLAYAF